MNVFQNPSTQNFFRGLIPDRIRFKDRVAPNVAGSDTQLAAYRTVFDSHPTPCAPNPRTIFIPGIKYFESINLRSAGRVIEPDEAFERCRAMPREVAKETARKNKQFYADLQYCLPNPRPDIKATVRLLSGCQEDELSWEGHGNGRFTEAIKKTFASGSFDGAYQDFHKQVREQLKARQRPNHAVRGVPNRAYDQQRPFTI